MKLALRAMPRDVYQMDGPTDPARHTSASLATAKSP
jgi:hypothetical protein